VIEQKGSPEEVYRNPRSHFVASFLGQSNLLSGEITSVTNGTAQIGLANGAILSVAAPPIPDASGKATVVIRAQRVSVGKASAPNDNRLKGRIASTSYLGGSAVYMIDCKGLTLQANNMIDDKVFREGEEVEVAIAPSDCVLLDERGLRFEG
jgi:spermidine/putrescine transport system ATP-binding protein